MRIRLPWQEKKRAGRRTVPFEERKLLIERGASERECFDTPSIRSFLDREDIVQLQAPSGWYLIFIRKPDGHAVYTAETLGKVVEQAMKGG